MSEPSEVTGAPGTSSAATAAPSAATAAPSAAAPAPSPTTSPSAASSPWDALVLAGGRGRRLGWVSKPDVLLAGRRLIEHTLAATAGAREVVVVGPAAVAPPGVRVTQEEPPGGGPVAGLAAGVAALPEGAATVLVLACDVPRAAGAVGALQAALGGDEAADGAALVDVDGRLQSLVALYRRGPLEAALARVAADGGPTGTSMRALVAGLRIVPVPDQAGYGLDVDTWADLERAERQAEA